MMECEHDGCEKDIDAGSDEAERLIAIGEGWLVAWSKAWCPEHWSCLPDGHSSNYNPDGLAEATTIKAEGDTEISGTNQDDLWTHHVLFPPDDHVRCRKADVPNMWIVEGRSKPIPESVMPNIIPFKTKPVFTAGAVERVRDKQCASSWCGCHVEEMLGVLTLQDLRDALGGE